MVGPPFVDVDYSFAIVLLLTGVFNQLRRREQWTLECIGRRSIAGGFVSQTLRPQSSSIEQMYTIYTGSRSQVDSVGRRLEEASSNRS